MEQQHIPRLLCVPESSFFLFGPRGVGKSTWLKETLPQALFFDLLDTSLFLELSRIPGRLGALIGNRSADTWIVIDEIQKTPQLLDEVHRLMKEKGWRFALSGSSARKLRRGGVNLLGGRAVTRELAPFSSKELGSDFDLDYSLQWGMLPLIQLNRKTAADMLSSYVNTYIKEEIREEGIVRSLQPFLRFIGIAGQMNGQLVNANNIAREAGIPRSTVDNYFSILCDTLLGQFLHPYRPGVKIREQAHSKFYWFDPGVARGAAGLLFDPLDRIWKGFAMETLIYNELKVHNHTLNSNREIFYYRTGSGTEIDFIVETRKRQFEQIPHIICIEVKMSESWNRKWEHSMRALESSEKVVVDRMIGVYNGTRSYHYDGIDVFPCGEFLTRLHNSEFF